MSSRCRRAGCAAALLLAATFAASPAAADDPAPHRLAFAPDYSPFTAREYVLTTIVGAEYLGAEFLAPSPTSANWTGGILWDDAARRVFVLRTRSGRNLASDISDAFTLEPQIQAFGLDSIAVPLLTDRFNASVGWQLTAMNLQALSLTGLLTRLGFRIVARERPSVAECRKDPDYSKSCRGEAPYASFPSGHTAAAFTAAALACSHHANLPLYGGGAADVAACVVPLLFATGDGVARLMADRHWSTDVLAGMAVGLVSGVGMPYLFHYRYKSFFDHDGDDRVRFRWAWAPLASSDVLGVQAIGLF
ncbi:MAG TPA: phosphatase PAP2 family protein [Minicystis sp.]|nr:phosphatase PAP2 family protein [Minicystis sp.]